MLLGRRCRDCGQPISARYFVIELITALFFVLVVVGLLTRSPEGEAGGGTALLAIPAYLWFAAVSVALAAIDLDVRRLPNRIVVPSAIVGMVLLAVATVGTGDWFMLARAAIAGVALLAFYFSVWFIYPKGMGFGDVKLAAVVGIHLGWLGWDVLLVGAFAAFLTGGLYSIALIAARRADRKTQVPFGPWMLLGAWIGIFFGNEIAAAYLGLFGLA